jgi:hypothetical protein
MSNYVGVSLQPNDLSTSESLLYVFLISFAVMGVRLYLGKFRQFHLGSPLEPLLSASTYIKKFVLISFVMTLGHIMLWYTD